MSFEARILIIDRHSQWLEFAVKVLEEVGYEVFVASDFSSAVDLFINNSFDLILIGLDQAENNLNVIKSIAKDKAHPERIVVMFPVRQTYDRMRIMFKAGVTDTVDKPYQPQVLRDIVAGQLAENRKNNHQTN